MAQCQHDKVVRCKDESFRCEYCGAEFFHLDLQPGKVMMVPPEPFATLRDQFAMALLPTLVQMGAPVESWEYGVPARKIDK